MYKDFLPLYDKEISISEFEEFVLDPLHQTLASFQEKPYEAKTNEYVRNFMEMIKGCAKNGSFNLKGLCEILEDEENPLKILAARKKKK